MDMKEHRHVYPLAVIAVWLVILVAWLLMGCAAKVKAVEVHDTTFVAHHDTTIIYKTAERVEVLRDTIRETITLREQGDTIKVERYVYVERNKGRADTIYRDRLVADTAHHVSTEQKQVKSLPWWHGLKLGVFFALCGVIIFAVVNYTNRKK